MRLDAGRKAAEQEEQSQVVSSRGLAARAALLAIGQKPQVIDQLNGGTFC